MEHLAENMYSVKLLFESIHLGKPDFSKIDEFYEEDNNKLFEESIILVKAKSVEEASKIGKEFAEKLEIEQKYFNMYGVLVTWKLRGVLHVFELDDVNFEIGKELYSRFLHVDKSLDFKTVIKNYYPECLE